MVRHGLNIVTVVFNNACWGMSQNGQDLIYGKNRRAIVSLRDSDYEKVCEAFGGTGARATQLEEIGPAMAAALAGGRPACVNVRVDGDIIHPVTMGMVGLSPKQAAERLAANSKKVVMPYYENVE